MTDAQTDTRTDTHTGSHRESQYWEPKRTGDISRQAFLALNTDSDLFLELLGGCWSLSDGQTDTPTRDNFEAGFQARLEDSSDGSKDKSNFESISSLDILQGFKSKKLDGSEEKIRFPLNVMDEFHCFEEALEDDAYKLQVVSELCLQGGTDARKQCRLVMSRILSAELAHTFNWLGRGNMNKVAFCNTHTADTIRRVMIQYGHTVQVAENEIKEFLRTSGDRMKTALRIKVRPPGGYPGHRRSDTFASLMAGNGAGLEGAEVGILGDMDVWPGCGYNFFFQISHKLWIFSNSDYSVLLGFASGVTSR